MVWRIWTWQVTGPHSRPSKPSCLALVRSSDLTLQTNILEISNDVDIFVTDQFLYFYRRRFKPRRTRYEACGTCLFCIVYTCKFLLMPLDWILHVSSASLGFSRRRQYVMTPIKTIGVLLRQVLN